MAFGDSSGQRPWRAVMVLAAGCVSLAGCDQLGIETPAKAAEHAHADAKAVGGACRHAMRAIEDCYILNPKAEKAAVYEGWREMDEYMRENKLEGVVPVVPRPPPPVASAPSSPKAASAPKADEDEESDASAKDAEEPASKAPAKKGKARSH